MGANNLPECGADGFRKIAIRVGLPPGTPSNASAAFVGNWLPIPGGGGYYKSPNNAQIWLNLSNPIFNSSQPNYGSAVQKSVHHELGHGMALADQPATPPSPNYPCGQIAGASIMNKKCDTNDSSNNQPNTPSAATTRCDADGAKRTGPVITDPAECTRDEWEYQTIEGGCYMTYRVIQTTCRNGYTHTYTYLSAVGPCVG